MNAARGLHVSLVLCLAFTLFDCGKTQAPVNAASDDGGNVSDASEADASTAFSIPQDLVFMIPMPLEGGGLPPAPGPGTVYEIGVINLDGSGFKQLTNDGTFKFLPHFSPDGSRIAYTKYESGAYGAPGSHADVAVFDLATNTETMVTNTGAIVQGSWSPDGAQIAYLAFDGAVGGGLGSIWIVDADGSNAHKIAAPKGTPTDMSWGDLAWSSENWLLFTVGQKVDNCFKVRTDKILPDGTRRTQVTDGGPSCTPPSMEQSGDADPGWSHDGSTIYSSRGFPVSPPNDPGGAVRKLYAFTSDAWYAGKPETDLSLPSEPTCVEGVPKGSPDGTRIVLFRICFDGGTASRPGIYFTDAAGSYRTFIHDGFGPDWNPHPAPKGP